MAPVRIAMPGAAADRSDLVSAISRSLKLDQDGVVEPDAHANVNGVLIRVRARIFDRIRCAGSTAIIRALPWVHCFRGSVNIAMME